MSDFTSEKKREIIDFLIENKIIKQDTDFELDKIKFKGNLEGDFIYTNQSNNNEKLFIKITEEIGEIELIYSLNEFLTERNLSAIPIKNKAGPLLYKEKEYIVYTRPFYEGKVYNNSEEDFLCLINTLNKIHISLKDFPEKDKIKEKSIKYNEKLRKIRDLLKQENSFESFKPYKEWLLDKKNEEFLKNITTREDIFEIIDCKNAQCLHGDLHSGNVIFGVDGKNAFLFDFNESYKAFAPVEYDLYYVLERFCLNNTSQEKTNKVHNRINAIKERYEAYDISLTKLLNMGEVIAMRLVLIVLDNYLNKNLTVNTEELDKFLNNFNNIKKYKDILIESEWEKEKWKNYQQMKK